MTTVRTVLTTTVRMIYDDGSDDSYVDAGGDSGDSGYEDGADYVDDEEVPWDYQ